ncbi:sorbitol dehydrogenase [Pseudomonas sp. NFXW11]|uniref:sorbitol dehydrogenase n=1 Tax=Pseudomonas sp. NFXW11 TaxID=2819531 RepID=UPI003CF9943C
MSSERENFVGLSSALLGIDPNRLAPTIDPIDLPSQFLAYIRPRLTESLLNDLLSQYASLFSAHEKEQEKIAQILLMNGNAPATTQAAMACRSIMKMWLLGVWYQPYDAGPYKKEQQSVVSDLAYQQSWAWKVAQAHPMGYSQFHFGYWSETPPSLEAFTGVPAKGQQGASS